MSERVQCNLDIESFCVCLCLFAVRNISFIDKNGAKLSFDYAIDARDMENVTNKSTK